jgi:hypothetical protein
MWGFIVWLIYGSYIPLSSTVTAVTPQCTSITPNKPMLVKGDGAALIVELPYAPSDHWPSGIISRLKKIDFEYPTGRLKATLYRANGSTVEIANQSVGAGNSEFQLALAPTGGFVDGDGFVRLRLCADPAIQDAHLFWRRVSK